MKMHQMFPSEYLSAGDLESKQFWPLVIERVEMREFNDSGSKPVIFFKGAKKGLVANKTNCEIIAAITGSDDSDDWTGTNIVLCTEMTTFKGKPTKCVRVSMQESMKLKRSPAPAAKKPAAARAPEPEPEQDLSDAPDDDNVPF